MKADELADKISDLLGEADSVQDAIYALTMVQYTIEAATRIVKHVKSTG